MSSRHTDPVLANRLRWDGRTPSHFEGFDVAVIDPAGQVGWWLRYTLDAPLEGPPYSTLWGAHFSAADPTQRFALRTKFPQNAFGTMSDGFHIRVSKAELTRSESKGGLRNPEDPGQSLRWNLRFLEPAEPLRPYPKKRMYKGSWPPARMLVPMPTARCRGVVEVGGERHEVKAGIAHQAHSWGTRHHDAWAWGMATRFREAKNAVVFATQALPRAGGKAFTALHYRDGAGQTYTFDAFEGGVNLDDLGRQPGVWGFKATGGRYRLVGQFSSSLQKMAGVAYEDPDGTERFVHHAGVADATVELYKRGFGSDTLLETLTASGTAVFQQGDQRPFDGVNFFL